MEVKINGGDMDGERCQLYETESRRIYIRSGNKCEKQKGGEGGSWKAPPEYIV